MPDETTTEVEEQAPAIDERYQALLDRLTAVVGDDAVIAAEQLHGELVVRVARAAWREVARACKERLGLTYFCFLSGIDWLGSKDLSSRYEQVWDPEGDADADGDGPEGQDGFDHGAAGGEGRFQVFARLYSTTEHIGITFKADVDDANPSIDSWVPVFRGADWHERETWEMFGFDFVGHPGLRHIYLPGEFEGHPLRKDFPLLSRVVKPWPGLVDKEPIPGEGDDAGEEA